MLRWPLPTRSCWSQRLATATRAPNAAVFTTNWQTPRVTALSDTAEPVAVTSNQSDFWVLTHSGQSAGLSRFAAQTAAPLGEVSLGPVKAVAIDGGVGAGQNNATPGGVVVATVTTPGKGQLVTFRGGNPSDPSPLVINLDGQPQAMSVVELAIGGNPVQYAWVTLMTPRGAAVECYNLATLQRTMTIDIGAVNAVDMTVGLPDGTSGDDDEEGHTGFVHVLAIE